MSMSLGPHLSAKLTARPPCESSPYTPPARGSHAAPERRQKQTTRLRLIGPLPPPPPPTSLLGPPFPVSPPSSTFYS
eukprot:3685478-Pyramimonas_sp.AAC.1